MKWNICLFIPVVMWLRDNLWTNLNQFCVNISANIMELIMFITHIWLYGRFYISEFTCFVSFPPTSVAIYVHVSRKSCCDLVATANWGRCCEWGGTKLCCVCSALFIAIYPYISFIFSSLHFLASSIFLNDLQKYFFPNILTT